MMFNGQTVLLLVGACLAPINSFTVPQAQHHRVRISTVVLNAEEETASVAATSAASTKTKQLGLLTFDLDDTLYPIQPIVEDANST